jgi:hypothetical protein
MHVGGGGRAGRGGCAPAVDIKDFAEKVGGVQCRGIGGIGSGGFVGCRADDDVGAVGCDVVLDGNAGVGADLRRRSRRACVRLCLRILGLRGEQGNLTKCILKTFQSLGLSNEISTACHMGSVPNRAQLKDIKHLTWPAVFVNKFN